MCCHYGAWRGVAWQGGREGRKARSIMAGSLARSLAPVQNRQLHLITIPFRASPTTVVGKRRSVLILQVTKRNSNFGRNERTNQRCALQRFDLVGERWMMGGEGTCKLCDECINRVNVIISPLKVRCSCGLCLAVVWLTFPANCFHGEDK